MKKKYLVAIGSNCIDEYYELLEVPQMGDKVVTRLTNKIVGGMIGNAASVYSNYGHDTYMIDDLNEEEDSYIILNDLKSRGIKTDFINVADIGSNTKCMIMLYKGERIIYVQENPLTQIDMTDKQKELLKDSAYVYTTISDLKRYKDTLNLIKYFTSTGSMLTLDVEGNTITEIKSDFEILKLASIIFVNDSGDARLKELVSENYYEELLDAGVKYIVITMAEKGCKVITKDESVRVEGIKVDVIDTTGAGDTFNSSFLHGLTSGWDLRKTAEFANAAAARSIQFIGPKSGVVDEKTVMDFILGKTY